MCETAVEILFSMIYAEYVTKGKFDTIETEIFARLEVLVSHQEPSLVHTDDLSILVYISLLNI
jgi:dedicator of cytokinesis protein 3